MPNPTSETNNLPDEEEGEFYVTTTHWGTGGMEGQIYYFTGNVSGDGYPPAWSWRKSLGMKLVRKSVAEAFAKFVAGMYHMPTEIMRVVK